MGKVFLPGVKVRFDRVVVPMKVVVLAIKLLKVTLPCTADLESGVVGSHE